MLPMDIVKRSMAIVGGAAQEIGSDYSSNSHQLISDANTIKTQVQQAGKTVSETFAQIKSQSVTKRISDWFWNKSAEFDAFDLGDDSDDFDNGSGAFSDDSKDKGGFKVLGPEDMKDIARGQIGEMYKIAGQQAAAGMANTAEIVTAFNARSSETVAAINNMNKTLLGIDKKLSGMMVQQAQAEKLKANNMFNHSGKLTLGGVSGQVQSAAKNSSAMMMASMILQAGQMGVLTPESVLVHGIQLSGLLDKKMFGGTKGARKFSLDDIGTAFNEGVGSVTHTVLKNLLETPQFKNLFGDFNKAGTSDFSKHVVQKYDGDPAVFDGRFHKSVVSIIPDILMRTHRAISGEALRIDSSGEVVSTPGSQFDAIMEKGYERGSTDYRVRRSFVDQVKSDNRLQRVSMNPYEAGIIDRLLTNVCVQYLMDHQLSSPPTMMLQSPTILNETAMLVSQTTGTDIETCKILIETFMVKITSSVTDKSNFEGNLTKIVQAYRSEGVKLANEVTDNSARRISKHSQYNSAVKALKEEREHGNDLSDLEDLEYKAGKLRHNHQLKERRGIEKQIEELRKKIERDVDAAKVKPGVSMEFTMHDYTRGIYTLLNRGINVKVVKGRAYPSYTLERGAHSKPPPKDITKDMVESLGPEDSMWDNDHQGSFTDHLKRIFADPITGVLPESWRGKIRDWNEDRKARRADNEDDMFADMKFGQIQDAARSTYNNSKGVFSRTASAIGDRVGSVVNRGTSFAKRKGAQWAEDARNVGSNFYNSFGDDEMAKLGKSIGKDRSLTDEDRTKIQGIYTQISTIKMSSDPAATAKDLLTEVESLPDTKLKSSLKRQIANASRRAGQEDPEKPSSLIGKLLKGVLFGLKKVMTFVLLPVIKAIKVVGIMMGKGLLKIFKPLFKTMQAGFRDMKFGATGMWEATKEFGEAAKGNVTGDEKGFGASFKEQWKKRGEMQRAHAIKKAPAESLELMVSGKQDSILTRMHTTFKDMLLAIRDPKAAEAKVAADKQAAESQASIAKWDAKHEGRVTMDGKKIIGGDFGGLVDEEGNTIRDDNTYAKSDKGWRGDLAKRMDKGAEMSLGNKVRAELGWGLKEPKEGGGLGSKSVTSILTSMKEKIFGIKDNSDTQIKETRKERKERKKNEKQAKADKKKHDEKMAKESKEIMKKKKQLLKDQKLLLEKIAKNGGRASAEDQAQMDSNEAAIEQADVDMDKRGHDKSGNKKGGAKAKMKGMAGAAGKGIASMLSGIMGLVKSMAAGMVKVAIAMEVMKAIGPLLQELMDTVMKPIRDILKIVVDVLATVLKPIFEFIGDVLAAVGKVVKAIMDTVMAIIAPIMKVISSILSSVLKVIGPILDVIITILNAILTPLMGFMEHIIIPILRTVGYTLQIIAGVVQIGLGTVIGILGTIVTAIGRVVSVIGLIPGVGAAARAVADPLIEQGQSMVSDGANMVRDGAGSIVEGIQGVGSVIQERMAVLGLAEHPDEKKSGPGHSMPVNDPRLQLEAMGDPYDDLYGNGPYSQRSYGDYLNMRRRGCGPVALADAYNRRTGGRVNPGELATSMMGSGTYEPNRGTSAGNMMRAGGSMGMGLRAGGVTSNSLRQASPTNPITVMGSGSSYGTRHGNNHYVNVVGSDSRGGAYVSNPLSGRVERQSMAGIVGNARLGLYGSGNDDPGGGLFSFGDDFKEAMRGLTSALANLTGMWKFEKSNEENIEEGKNSIRQREQQRQSGSIISNTEFNREIMDRVWNRAKLAWQALRRDGDRTTFEQYVESNPNSPHIAEAIAHYSNQSRLENARSDRDRALADAMKYGCYTPQSPGVDPETGNEFVCPYYPGGVGTPHSKYKACDACVAERMRLEHIHFNSILDQTDDAKIGGRMTGGCANVGFEEFIRETTDISKDTSSPYNRRLGRVWNRGDVGDGTCTSLVNYLFGQLEAIPKGGTNSWSTGALHQIFYSPAVRRNPDLFHIVEGRENFQRGDIIVGPSEKNGITGHVGFAYENFDEGGEKIAEWGQGGLRVFGSDEDIERRIGVKRWMDRKKLYNKAIRIIPWLAQGASDGFEFAGEWPNFNYALERLRAEGFGDAQIAAIMGTLMKETGGVGSHDIDPTSGNENTTRTNTGIGQYRGILRWRNDRQTALNLRTNPGTMSTQMDFLLDELMGNEPGNLWGCAASPELWPGPPDWPHKNNYSDELDNIRRSFFFGERCPEEATNILSYGFVRPNNIHVPARLPLARRIYESLKTHHTPIYDIMDGPDGPRIIDGIIPDGGGASIYGSLAGQPCQKCGDGIIGEDNMCRVPDCREMHVYSTPTEYVPDTEMRCRICRTQARVRADGLCYRCSDNNAAMSGQYAIYPQPSETSMDYNYKGSQTHNDLARSMVNMITNAPAQAMIGAAGPKLASNIGTIAQYAPMAPLVRQTPAYALAQQTPVGRIVQSVFGSGDESFMDIPPIQPQFWKAPPNMLSDTFGMNNNVMPAWMGDQPTFSEEHLRRVLRNTFKVRSEEIENLLKKMIALMEGGKPIYFPPMPKQSTGGGDDAPYYDDEIPEQFLAMLAGS
jgi:hypothetical protein